VGLEPEAFDDAFAVDAFAIYKFPTLFFCLC